MELSPLAASRQDDFGTWICGAWEGRSTPDGARPSVGELYHLSHELLLSRSHASEYACSNLPIYAPGQNNATPIIFMFGGKCHRMFSRTMFSPQSRWFGSLQPREYSRIFEPPRIAPTSGTLDSCAGFPSTLHHIRSRARL